MAPTAPIEPFVVVGPTGPDRELELKGVVALVDGDEREKAVAARSRTVATKMTLERRSGGEEATRAGCEADAAVAAPTAPIESFLVVGPIGPDRELKKL